MKRWIVWLLVLLLFVCPAQAQTVRESTNAPENLEVTFTSNTGKTKVIVDAKVYVPDVEQINTYAVAGRDFTLEDVKAVAMAAAPETDWLTDWQVRVKSPYYSRWSGNRDDYQYNDVDKNGRFGYILAFRWYPQDNGSEGYFPYQYGHEAGYVSGLNRFQETAFGVRRSETALNYSYGKIADDAATFYAGSTYFEQVKPLPADESRLSQQVLTWGEAREMAETFIAEVSPDFTLYWVGQASGEQTSRKAYAFLFTRVVDQIPVTYADNAQAGEEIENQQYTSPPDMEKITMVIDQERIVNVCWSDPWAVGDVLQENVTLMPFSSIMDIFGTIAPLSIQSMENENQVMGGESNRWEISEIRLGYMPVLRKDDSGEWELRPVWDFIGTRIFAKEYYDDVGNCAMTIDAIDGTIIDRAYGY